MSQTQTPIDVENLFAAIAHRRSMGLSRLNDDPVPTEILQQALEAANWAPSNGDTEPWRFTVFAGDARLKLGDAFAEAYKQSAEAEGNFREETYKSSREKATWAPVWISIGMEPGRLPSGELAMPGEEEAMAVACAVQNLHLILSAHGLLGMWHSGTTSVHPHVAQFVGLESPAKLLGFFWCGYPNIPWPAGERKPLDGKVKWAE